MSFIQGTIEDLSAIPIVDSIDIIISNCVVNLCRQINPPC